MRDPVAALRVRNAFVHQQAAIEQAAAAAGVSARTARRWKSSAAKSGDDWDKARAARHEAAQSLDVVARQVLEDYLTLHKSTIEGLKAASDVPPLAKAEALSRLADAWTKTLNAAGRLAPDISRLAVANDVLQMLAEFIGRDYPQHRTALLEVLEPFGEHVAAKLG